MIIGYIVLYQIFKFEVDLIILLNRIYLHSNLEINRLILIHLLLTENQNIISLSLSQQFNQILDLTDIFNYYKYQYIFNIFLLIKTILTDIYN